MRLVVLVVALFLRHAHRSDATANRCTDPTSKRQNQRRQTAKMPYRIVDERAMDTASN